MRIQSGLLSLATPDLARLKIFYQTLLRQDPVVEIKGKYIEFRLLGIRLGLYQSGNSDFQACLGATSLCLQVSDLDPWLSLPILRGVSVVRTASHGREVDCTDPDGNRIVIHQPSPEFWRLLGIVHE